MREVSSLKSEGLVELSCEMRSSIVSIVYRPSEGNEIYSMDKVEQVRSSMVEFSVDVLYKAMHC